MKYKFYKRENRQVVPVTDKKINLLAEEKLKQIFNDKKVFLTLTIKFQENFEDVSLFHPSGDIEKSNALLINPEDGAYSLNNKINHLTGKEWTKFTKSWFVFDALHSDIKEEKEISSQVELNSDEHPATYSPTMTKSFIEFFTKEGEIVFDPFSGIGSTQVGAQRANRIGIGIELNPKYAQIANLRVSKPSFIINGNSLKLKTILKKNKVDRIDFSISSPPYWDILNRSTGDFEKKRLQKSLDVNYSDNHTEDVGHINDYTEFIDKCAEIYFQIYDLLKPGGYVVVIIKNVKKDGRHYPLAWDLAKKLMEKYDLKDEKIWCQDKQSLSPFGYPFSWTSNIVHHYCLIFQKSK
jgi:DNA modification methylase